MGQCLFCAIVAGNVPCDEVFGDDEILAFRDINPQGPVHILVIPRQHLPGMKVLTDADAPSLGRLLVVASRIAAQEGLDRDGYRCVINQGTHGCQSVDHLHLHLIGGRQLGWPPG
jgi:histidine triad (HIT) family protein